LKSSIGKTAMGVKGRRDGSVGRRPRAATASTAAARRKPTISIVGAGRLGTALARALASCGYTVEAVVARTSKHARRAAELIGTRPLALTALQLARLPSSDILFITTPDDLIEATAWRLAATFETADLSERNRWTRTVLHASGALSSGVLRALREAGFQAGSMHPLVSVSDSLHGAERLGTAFFCLEGDAHALKVARGLVRSLGARSFSIGAGKKALYHAAAVMASGHTTALFDISMEMLTRCGLTKHRARTVLLPLLQSTLENLRAVEPESALTGTFARADRATVRRHLDALRAERLPEALAAYLLLGARSLELARSKGAPALALKQIARDLEGRRQKSGKENL
jgi:predicted short-subunit dehydrogenase-like oxidoreductase (DUF2520 family)